MSRWKLVVCNIVSCCVWCDVSSGRTTNGGKNIFIFPFSTLVVFCSFVHSFVSSLYFTLLILLVKGPKHIHTHKKKSTTLFPSLISVLSLYACEYYYYLDKTWIISHYDSCTKMMEKNQLHESSLKSSFLPCHTFILSNDRHK